MSVYHVNVCIILVTPKAPPVITSSPVRIDDQNSTEITFKVV